MFKLCKRFIVIYWHWQRPLLSFIVLLSLVCHVKTLATKSSSRKTLRSGNGFGGNKIAKVSTPETVLSKTAKNLLEKHNYNVDAASSEYMASLNPTDEDSRIVATWDTVALFLPHYYQQTNFKVEGYVHRRMNCIAAACKDRILDVGCGDGAILRYLSPKDYYGLDVSSQMIALAKSQHSKYNFQVGSFPKDLPRDTNFDCVLFNGSLQFFADTLGTLRSARDLLSRDNPGRIVISHVHGASFVLNECRSKIAIREMPTMDMLRIIADDLGLNIVTKGELFGASLNPADVDDKKFYLVVLEKQ